MFFFFMASDVREFLIDIETLFGAFFTRLYQGLSGKNIFRQKKVEFWSFLVENRQIFTCTFPSSRSRTFGCGLWIVD